MSGEHHFHGSTTTARGILYFNSLDEISSAEDIGIGAVFVAGKLYWSNGSDLIDQNSNCAIIVDPPEAADSAGVAGQIAYDASYLYVCVDTDTWLQVAIATWGGE